MTYQAALTHYAHLNAQPQLSPIEETVILNHLRRNDRAVVIEGDNGMGYIFNNGSIFYYGEWPAEDPNDAEAADTVPDALIGLMSIVFDLHEDE